MNITLLCVCMQNSFSKKVFFLKVLPSARVTVVLLFNVLTYLQQDTPRASNEHSLVQLSNEDDR